MEKKPLLISIDFEDIYNDYLFRLNLNEDYIIREKFLFDSYQVIKKVFEKFFKKQNLTFFTTGILAEKAPDLIKEISDDGNEIACHHYLQEDLRNKSEKNFEDELINSKKYLSKASQKEILGYRAPNFCINDNLGKYLKYIFSHFDYDSSIYHEFKNHSELKSQIFQKKKKEFFCFNYKLNFIGKKIRIKTGGTFFRVLNKKIIKKILDESHVQGFVPIIYLHPYDFLTNKEFWVEIDKFNDFGFIKKYYSYFRQFQWHSLGNKSVYDKLMFISKYFDHKGNMKDFNN